MNIINFEIITLEIEGRIETKGEHGEGSKFVL